MTVPIPVPYAELSHFCEQRAIRRLSWFGSVLGADFTPESDLDVLVEYEPGAVVTLIDMAEQELVLSRLFGRKVDLRTEQDLSRYFRQAVLNQAQVFYPSPIASC